ncbi:unnamed protein product [Litomosoides sigmodontis]|uniref:Splicing factor YJU2 n=1 Tax=Litomosoides sigmodontis TaxID=42156 RepID=A0A3P6TGJ4_LITSI|nr:unnamed protein product [Litomosoides sigmodontis]
MTGTERKKYYPPDFDPSKIPRAKGQRNRQFVQRVMAPYNMQCDTCHEYIYKVELLQFQVNDHSIISRTELEAHANLDFMSYDADRYNALKLPVEPMGSIERHRTFKLYQQEEKAKETKEEEEKKDPMKMLEKRTKMSRAEMEALGKLEELQETNRRHETFDPDQYFGNLVEAQAEALRLQEEEDEKFIRKLYVRTEDGKVVKRILDDENEDVKTPIYIKREIKHEPMEEDQKPSCSSIDVPDVKPGTAGQAVVVAHKRSQKELLSRIVAVKKQKAEGNEPKVVTTKIEHTTGSHRDLSECSTSEKIEKNERPASLAPSLSALQGLADYCSDSSSD